MMKSYGNYPKIDERAGLCRILLFGKSINDMKMSSIVSARILGIFIVCITLLSTSAVGKTVAPFDASPLVTIGDSVSYGSYIIYKLDEGIFKINDPGTTTGSGGAWGVDMYLICGEKKALMIDLGNNYINGKAGNNIAPRENAAEELRAVVYGLKGKLPLEIAITHGHGDHTGMAGAFIDQGVTFWKSGLENPRLRPKKIEPAEVATRQLGSAPSVDYTLFTPGEKTFDLGGGRIVETLSIQGHTDDGTVYILKKDGMIFTGDTMGSGFGLAFRTAIELKRCAEGTRRLVDYIFANFKPFERYAFRVCTGHSWQNNYVGFVTPNSEKLDVGYLDWRFIQNMASCTNGILEGKWLVKGSGLIYEGDMEYLPFWGDRAVGMAIMVHGIGCVITPIEVVYEAAGLKMPDPVN